MLITLRPGVEERLSTWSMETKQPAEKFINETLENALEDFEDYTEAVKICAEVDGGRMKTYSKKEVWRELDAMED